MTGPATREGQTDFKLLLAAKSSVNYCERWASTSWCRLQLLNVHSATFPNDRFMLHL